MNHVCVEPYDTFVANLKAALYPDITIVKTEGKDADGLVTIHLQGAERKWQFFWLGAAGIGTITDDQTRTHEGKFDLAAKRASEIVTTIQRFVSEHSSVPNLQANTFFSKCPLCVALEKERKAEQ